MIFGIRGDILGVIFGIRGDILGVHFRRGDILEILFFLVKCSSFLKRLAYFKHSTGELIINPPLRSKSGKSGGGFYYFEISRFENLERGFYYFEFSEIMRGGFYYFYAKLSQFTL